MGQDLSENNYILWSSERIIIPKTTKKLKSREVNNIEDRIDRYGFPSDKLKLKSTIYMDMAESDSVIHVETNSILDTYKSFNYLHCEIPLQIYANLHFDLTEIYRRQFLKNIDPYTMSIEEIEVEYLQISNTLEHQHQLLRKEAFAGTDLNQLSKWNKLVLDKLGIDNFKLFNIDIKVIQERN